MLVIDVVWGAIILAFLGFEAWTINNKVIGDTFSERVRHYFLTDRKGGAFAFLALFGAGAAWFAAHIVQIAV